MKRIRILPDTLANQIAAGEVVERPASVIKEMIENSIDAGAKRIAVETELGGRRLMRISDDGHGMMRDDAILAFERHATSKINSLDDLGAIDTLGFRGEALASIASVAKVEMLTKISDDHAATRVVIEGGRLIDVKEGSRDTGTTLAVRDLFFNTPARRKFMRSEATENFHIANIVTHYALAHPEINFSLTNNGREVVRSQSAANLKERAFQLFGPGMIDSMIPVSGGREYVAKVTGFVSAPRERRTTRDSQYFFVNKRFVRDKTIGDGLRDAYRSVLPYGAYPVAFLFIELPIDEIDVNVHPAKTEVRFRRGEAIRETVSEAVRNALAQAGIVAEENSTNAATILNKEVEIPQDAHQIAEMRETAKADEEILAAPDLPLMRETLPEIASASSLFTNEVTSGLVEKKTVNQDILLDLDPQEFERKANERAERSEEAVFPPLNSAAAIPRSIEVDQIAASAITPLGQLRESFIIAVAGEDLLLIDQHVAHERILFDRFLRSQQLREKRAQNLLLPETFDLTPAQAEVFSIIESELEILGFGIMRLSGRTVAIKSVPADLAAAEAKNLLSEVLESVDPERRAAPERSITEEVAASLACKAAIKVNMKLTPEKMRWLIDRLVLTSSPTTCPHGRPIILRLSMRDIERGFHRI